MRRRATYVTAGALIAGAAVSVALACSGADRALDIMRHHAAIGVVGVVALAASAALVWTWRRPAAALLHLGFALVSAGWIIGMLFSPQDGYLRLRAGQVGSVGGAFNFALSRFAIDRWPDTGTVRQYTSHGTVDGVRQDISVNHPLVRAGWWVYQSSYEETVNPHTGQPLHFTILLCVKEAGLPLVGTGGLLLLAGALLLAFCRRDGAAPAERAPRLPWTLYALSSLGSAAMVVHRGLSTGHAPMQNMYEFLMCVAAVLPALTVWAWRNGDRKALLVDAALQALVLVPVAFFMDGRVRHLMPALQSPFFVPHVGAYVFGYVILVRAAFGVGRRLVGAGVFLLTLGLVLGAAWGKVCWGHWWQFDPKEMWSLATWLVYAAYLHVRPTLSLRGERIFLAAGAVMIVLTLTWINLSRLFTGMHSYA